MNTYTNSIKAAMKEIEAAISAKEAEVKKVQQELDELYKTVAHFKDITTAVGALLQPTPKLKKVHKLKTKATPKQKKTSTRITKVKAKTSVHGRVLAYVQGKDTITTKEVNTMLKKHHQNAGNVLGRMVKDGTLAHGERGSYIVVTATN